MKAPTRRRGSPASTTAKFPRWLGGALATAGLAAGLAACGGGGKKAGVAGIGTTTTTAAVATRHAPAQPGQFVGDLAKYANCMRTHGVAGFPDPNVSGNTVKLVLPASLAKSPKFASARRACRKYAPAKLAPPQITTADQADYLKAAECMRSHGIAGFPDPKFSNGTVTWPIPPGMDTNSTQFLRAREICQMLIPAGLPYSKEAEGGR